MKRFIEGADRAQSTMLPESLDDWIADSNPVRAVDVFVERLNLVKLGFDGVVPEATGRPSYHPSVLLKLYIYGRRDIACRSCLRCEPVDRLAVWARPGDWFAVDCEQEPTRARRRRRDPREFGKD